MVLTLAGSNVFLLRQALNKLTAEFEAEHGDMALEQLDGEEASYERIAEAVQSLPFLANRKMVVLKSPGAQKQFLEKYGQLLSDASEIIDVIIVEPNVDKRTAYYKWLKKHTEFQEFSEPDERTLVSWLVSFAKEQGSSISSADASYLIHRIGSSQQRLASEISKLALSGPDITRDIINDQTEATPQSKIFDLLDAAFAGQSKRALELYQEQRALRVEPQEIIAMLGWQLRQVALVKTAGTKHSLTQEARMSPFSVKKSQRIASRLSVVRLKELVQELTLLDARSKHVPLDLDEALQNFILHLA
jgi:DNA polymerase-3 subunit delta